MRNQDPQDTGPSVFISYRHSDTAGIVERVRDQIVSQCPGVQVLADTDGLQRGAETLQRAQDHLPLCDVVLVLIGRRWDGGKGGKTRLIDDPEDPFSIEIALALQTARQIVPVLVDGVRMPSDRDLPEHLAGLLRFKPVELRHASFGADVNELIARIAGKGNWRAVSSRGQGRVRRGSFGRAVVAALSGMATAVTVLVAGAVVHRHVTGLALSDTIGAIGTFALIGGAVAIGYGLARLIYGMRRA